MINRLDLRGRSLSARELAATLPRPEVGVEDATKLVAPIVDDVRSRGAAALRDYADFQHAALRQTLTDTAQTRLPLQAITMQELQRRIQDEGVVLVDVRPQAEFAQGHIPGALNIPVAQLQQHLGSLPAQTGIVAYCRDPFCISSTQAVELLQAQGFQAQRLIGGVPEWAALGGDVAQGVEPASASGPAALDR